jgi:hypothetical protein
MIIEVQDGVFWDTTAHQQSEEAIRWLQEEVKPNLGPYTLDMFERPCEAVYVNNYVSVTEKQIYINNSYDWARKGVIYNVEKL